MVGVMLSAIHAPTILVLRIQCSKRKVNDPRFVN